MAATTGLGDVSDRHETLREFLIASGIGIRCANCNATNLSRPNITLYTSKCGHDECDNCLMQLYERRATIPCRFATCHELLKKSDFRVKEFQSGSVHKEMLVRDELSKIYCMTFDDFGGDTARYDAYLEEIENIIFNLVNGIDLDATKAKVVAYRNKHSLMIDSKQRESKNERRAQRDAIKAEKKATEERRRVHAQQRGTEHHELKLERARLQQQLLNADPSQIAHILNKMKQLRDKSQTNPPASSTTAHGVSDSKDEISVQAEFQPQSTVVDASATLTQPMAAPLYVYQRSAAVRQTGGPSFLATPQLAARSQHLAQCHPEIANPTTAAGYNADIAARRALQDAFSCLFGLSLDDS